MKSPIILVCFWLQACHINHPVNENQSSVQSLGALKRLGSPGKMVSLMVGHRESSLLVEKLSPVERASLFVTAENREIREPGAINPMKVPYYKFPSRAGGTAIETKVEIQGFSGSSSSAPFARRLANAHTKDPCGPLGIVPYHPDSKKNHPLIEKLRSKGAPSGTLTLDAFHSMSRSLMIVNERDKTLPTLFSLKMGTDTVNGRPEDRKLFGLQEEVAEVNELTHKTSIPRLMQDFGITYIMDAVGVNIHEKGADPTDDAKNYGYIIRDYSEMLRDKNYIYLPMDVFKGRVTGGQSGDFTWRLDDQVELKIPPTHLQRYVNDLAYETGKFKGIYLANGAGHDSFHGQNVLVGIPLDPANHAKLGFRDVGDSHDFLPRIQKGSEDLELRIADPNWCMVLRGWNGVRPDQCLGEAERQQFAGFKQVVEKIGFTARDDQGFSRLTTITDVYQWAESKSHWKTLVSMIESVRSVSSFKHQTTAATKSPARMVCPIAPRQAMRACMLRTSP